MMEAARLNRYREQQTAIVTNQSGQVGSANAIDFERTADIFIGPYYFKDLSDAQRLNARLPRTFQSPFVTGLKILISLLLRRGWGVVPWLCWHGAISPRVKGHGCISFSYHTRGKIEGRFHYKFGHFSDIVQIDPAGYAGFSSLAEIASDELLRATENVSRREISETVETYRKRYIAERFTWRTQVSGPPSALPRKGKRTIFLPLQDPLDEVAELAYVGPDGIVRVLAQVLDDEDVVYVKRHPSTPQSVRMQ